MDDDKPTNMVRRVAEELQFLQFQIKANRRKRIDGDSSQNDAKLSLSLITEQSNVCVTRGKKGL